MKRLVPIKNLSGEKIVVNEISPNVWGYDDDAGLVECGEPRIVTPDYLTMLEDDNG